MRWEPARSSQQLIVGKLRDFLAEDLANRNKDERWFLDKGDGSVWFASPDGITKGIKKILSELGIEGGAIHFFRKVRLNEIWEKNTNDSTMFGRHQNQDTTEQHYTSGEKPEGLVERIDEIDRQNDLLN